MFHMRNLKLMMPRGSEFRLVFPLLMYTFRYDRSSFSIEKVNDKCSENEFNSVMDNIEKTSEYFKRFLVVKLVSLFSLVSLALLLVIGIGIVAYDAILNNNRTKETFKNLTKDPEGHLMSDKSNDLSDVTVIGIFLMILGLFQFILIIVILNFSTRRAIRDYSNKINFILLKTNEQFLERGIKWSIGDGCLWVELRLDFKYSQLAMNSDQFIRNKYGNSQQAISNKDPLNTPPRSYRMLDFNEKHSLNDSFESSKENKLKKNKLKGDDEDKKSAAKPHETEFEMKGHFLLDAKK